MFEILSTILSAGYRFVGGITVLWVSRLDKQASSLEIQTSKNRKQCHTTVVGGHRKDGDV